MINWKPFFDNSSTRDSLINFVEGESFNKAFLNIKHPFAVTSQFSIIKSLPIAIVRKRAKMAIARHQ